MNFQCVTYIATPNTLFSFGTNKKKVELAILEIVNGPVGGYETTTYEEKFKVPAVPPSNLQNCKIIDLEYEIKIKAHTELLVLFDT